MALSSAEHVSVRILKVVLPLDCHKVVSLYYEFFPLFTTCAFSRSPPRGLWMSNFD